MVILSALFICFATDSWSSFLFFYDQECARASYRPPSWVSKPHSNAPPPDDVGLDPGCRRKATAPELQLRLELQLRFELQLRQLRLELQLACLG